MRNERPITRRLAMGLQAVSLEDDASRSAGPGGQRSTIRRWEAVISSRPPRSRLRSVPAASKLALDRRALG
jgi:hypothetical protein